MRSMPENMGEIDLSPGAPKTRKKRRTVVVCGPTASGKTALADEVSDLISVLNGVWTKTLVADSMQVYQEIPNITNQQRGRPAELVGIVSVSDEWNMARHRDAAEEVLEETGGPFVLDSGTGMYLNTLIMDIDIAPKISSQVREKAASEVGTTGSINQRRAIREKELEISGYKKQGSIWTPSLRYDVSIIYLRPDRVALDSAIERRSKKISASGLEEADHLLELRSQGIHINPSVTSSIGVQELTDLASGTCTAEEAETRISARTRKLARRQMRWFDKLARTLSESADITVAEKREDIPPLDSMSYILEP